MAHQGSTGTGRHHGKLKCPLPSGQLALPEKDAVVPIILKGLGENFKAAETKETNSPGTERQPFYVGDTTQFSCQGITTPPPTQQET